MPNVEPGSSSPTIAPCQHCGTAFIPTPHESDYCCAGCRFVHDWINQQGLDRFYDLKGNRVTDAVGSTVFQPQDWEWARHLQEETEDAAIESGSNQAAAEVHLNGMSCVACAWLIEKRFQTAPGALRIQIEPNRGRARLTWKPGDFSLPALCEDLKQFGYLAGPHDATGDAENRALGVKLGLTAGLALNTMGFTLPHYLGLDRTSDLGVLCDLIALASATLAVLTGGGYFFQRAWNGLRAGTMHVDLPIALGIAVAYLGAIGGWIFRVDSLFYVDFVATFIFLMLGGRWLQERALQRAQRRQRHLDAIPLDHQKLRPGEPFTVQPGGVVPVEATVDADSATVSLEWITGEPDPMVHARGQIVPAGAKLLAQKPLPFHAREPFAGSALARLLESRSNHLDPLLQRVLPIYLYAVLVIAVIGLIAWYPVAGLAKALSVFIAILVVSCPCALGVAVPLVNARAALRMERLGLFLRNTGAWNRLRQVRRLVVDKTGTLTLPLPRLENHDALEGLDENGRRALLRLVTRNLHPFARSLHEALGLAAPDLGDVHEEAGSGVWFRDESGHEWSLGRPGWKTAPIDGDGDVVLARDATPVAAFRFAEALRPQAREDLEHLRASFPGLVILSGDAKANVLRVAEEAGIPAGQVHGRMKPEEKATWLRENGGDRTLYLGDGANDSLAFEEALVTGSPSTAPGFMEGKSDFVFLGRGLSVLQQLFTAAQWRHARMVLIFIAAVLYNLLALGICLAGLMNPLLAAILMPLSSILLLILAQR